MCGSIDKDTERSGTWTERVRKTYYYWEKVNLSLFLRPFSHNTRKHVLFCRFRVVSKRKTLLVWETFTKTLFRDHRKSGGKRL